MGAHYPEVKSLPWQGSGDIAALSARKLLLVVAADRIQVNVGETRPNPARKDVI